MTTRVTRAGSGLGRARSSFRVVGVLAAALLIALVTGCAAKTPQEQTEAGFIGGQALTRFAPEERLPAPIVAGPALSGRGTVTTADYRGKVIVLNVWGSWCGPCRKEAPDLVEASKDTAATAAFVGINIRDSNPDTARAFVRAFQVPYPHIYDPDGGTLVKFAGTLPPNGIPTTLIIDKQGRIAVRVVGTVTRTSLVDMIDDIERGR